MNQVIPAPIEIADKEPSDSNPCTAGDKMNSLDPAPQSASLVLSQTDLISEVIENLQPDQTPNMRSASCDEQAMNESISTSHATAQSEPDVIVTTETEADEAGPMSFRSESSIACPDPTDSTTARTTQEDDVSLERIKRGGFPAAVKALHKVLDPRKQNLGLGLVQFMKDKFYEHKPRRSRPNRNANPHPSTYNELQKLLRPSNPKSTDVLEEDIHPWGVTSPSLRSLDTPLMRIWDESSKSRIRFGLEELGFLAAASDTPLTTFKKRRQSLERLAKWNSRYNVPHISVTASTELILRLVSKLMRRHKKSHGPFNAMLSLINPHARLKSGLPMLRMPEELLHYGLDFLAEGLFYADEIIMLFRITKEEIIKTYPWIEIEGTMQWEGISFEQWYDKYAMADFRMHERERRLEEIEALSIAECRPGESIDSEMSIDDGQSVGGGEMIDGGQSIDDKRAFVRPSAQSGKRKAETNRDSNVDHKRQRVEGSK